MNKLLKYAGYTLSGLLFLLVLVVTILKLIPDTQYKLWITSAVESSTGRGFSMESLELDFGRSLRISVSDAKLNNAAWAKQSDMLSVEYLHAELPIWPLFSGRAEIRTRLDRAEIIAQSNESGVSNWDMSSGLPAAEISEQALEGTDQDSKGSVLAIRPVIRELSFNNIKLVLADANESNTKTALLNQLLIETPEQHTRLTLQAEVKGTPIELSGDLGNIDAALNHASTALKLSGAFDQNKVNISGEWGPVLPETNLNLLFNLQVPSASSIAAIAGYDMGDISVLDLQARLRATQGTFAIEDIITQLDGEQTQISINGGIDDIRLMQGVDLGIELNTEILAHLIKELNIELPVPIPSAVQLSTKVKSGKNGLSINNIKVHIRDEGLDLTLNGSITHLLSSRQIDVDFNANLDSLSALSKYAGIDLPALGAINLSGRLASEGEAISLSALTLNLRAENLNLDATGKVKDVLTVNGIDAHIAANISSLSEQNVTELSSLLKSYDIELPVDVLPQSLNIKTAVSGNLESLRLSDIRANVIDEDISISLTGDVEDVLTVDGIDAHIAANISSLSEQNVTELSSLLKSYDIELPVDLLPQSLNIKTAVSGNLESLRLSDIRANVIDEDISISLTGEVENALIPSGVSATLVLNTESIAAFSKHAGTQLPDLGPLEATARVVSENKTYRLESLEATVSTEELQAKLDASIADLLSIKGIEAQLLASSNSLSSLSDLAQTPLPASDPIQVHAILNGKDLEQASLDIKAETTGVVIAINSLLAQLNSANDLIIDVSVQADSLSNFDKFIEKELPEQGPLDLSASISLQPGSYTLSELQLQLGDESATGEAMLVLPDPDKPDDITRLHGLLDIGHLNLARFLPQPASEEETSEDVEEEEATEASLASSGRLFSSAPIQLQQLHDYAINFIVNAETIDFGKTNLQNFKLDFVLKDGLLNIGLLSADATDGKMQGHVQLDGRNSPPILDADILLDEMPMPNLGGTLDFHLDLEGTGRSVAELMAGINGQILIVARDGVIEESIATWFGSGMLSFSGDKKNTHLECAILRVDVVDGIADFKNKLAAQMTEVTWRGGGEINFKTERLKADIAPKIRKGIPISVSGSLAGLVKLGGTLKAPKIVPDYSDAAIKYGKYAAYVSTGGLSLLAEIIVNKVRANQDVCAKILDGTVFETVER